MMAAECVKRDPQRAGGAMMYKGNSLPIVAPVLRGYRGYVHFRPGVCPRSGFTAALKIIFIRLGRRRRCRGNLCASSAISLFGNPILSVERQLAFACSRPPRCRRQLRDQRARKAIQHRFHLNMALRRPAFQQFRQSRAARGHHLLERVAAAA